MPQLYGSQDGCRYQQLGDALLPRELED